MKTIHGVIRIFTQLIIAGPVIYFFPFIVVFGIIAPIMACKGELGEFKADDLLKIIALELGLVSCLGLYGSILIPLGVLRRFRVIRWVIVLCMICGILGTSILIVGILLTHQHSPYTLWDLWFFGGPIVVALWNLLRIYNSERQSSLVTAKS